MMIVSFAWTTDALLAGRKHRTRRDWWDDYAARFHNLDLVQAYDRQPRYHGKRIAIIRITAPLRKESTAMLTEQDYELEGFAYMEEHRINIWNKHPRQAFKEWKESAKPMWVMDFDLKDESL